MSDPLPPFPPGPAPGAMPGATRAAVVLLWIGVGFGVCGGLASLFGAATLGALEDDGQVILPESFMPLLVVSIVQITVWTVLRGVFAVKIARRSATARKGAVILEAVGLALSLVSWVVTPDIEVVGAPTQTNEGAAMVGAVLGAAVAAVVIGTLMSEASRRWCDR
ncbi:hypothetical protein [Glycomyces paridis]|uniref:DUF2975 domain-containing protein n=1 Tax=Glycomyces paridis TaxID=2126555 RepID=A0A4S8PHP9_9ACTN|nr:hypothetical protein [Glycomyces paridis]THV30138.1 hypothetical protein E9998_07110 [Glycomyces paridis]